MKRLHTILAFAALLSVLSCHEKPAPEPTPTPEPEPETEVVTPDFAKGADISWVTEMEAGGRTFKKQDGTQADIFEVLKETGINAIRLRVWVDPEGGWSGKDDVVALATRASKAGMALMVDFHYSDFFADPSRQTIPAAWEADRGSLDKLADHVSTHTTEVLQALKDAGVTPAWVQIGNETRNGMLWPAGQLWAVNGSTPGGWSAFAKLYMAGYNAAKSVFPDILAMPHLNNAWDISSNDWWFKEFKKSGTKFDAIALSHYPQYETNPVMTPTEVSNCAIAEIPALAGEYKVPVMISEVGVKTSENEALASEILSYFMKKAKEMKDCAGVFYWEPEVDGIWKPAVYSKWGWNAYDLGAFTKDGRATTVMAAFK